MLIKMIMICFVMVHLWRVLHLQEDLMIKTPMLLNSQLVILNLLLI